mgnify:CR=1 FL=1
MIRLVAAAVFVLFASQAASADALTAQDIKRCKAMAATLAPKKAEIAELKAKRDELAVVVEDKGDTWENAEALRLLSSGHAQSADAAKADYQATRQELARADQALQALLHQFNQDISAYNNSCAAED